LVATLQVKKVKVLITCSCKESPKKNLKREINDKQEKFKERKLNQNGSMMMKKLKQDKQEKHSKELT